MKKILHQMLTALLFIIATACIYLAVNIAFFSSFFNVAIGIVAIMIIIIACGEIDKIHGFGKYSATTETQIETNLNPTTHHHHHSDDNIN